MCSPFEVPPVRFWDLAVSYKIGYWNEEATYIYEPRLDSAEKEFILLVCPLNVLVVIYHPAQLDCGEISGERETSPVHTRCIVVNSH